MLAASAAGRSSSPCCSVRSRKPSRCAKSAAAWRARKENLDISAWHPPKRATLSYATEHRPWQLYQTVFEQLYSKCHGQFEQAKKQRRMPARKSCFRHRLMSIDASLVFLLADAFDWVRYHRGKGAVKIFPCVGCCTMPTL